jgi:hypothetical protein
MNSTREHRSTGLGPDAKFEEIFLLDEELRVAGWANHRERAIAPRFAPFQDVAERVAFPFAKVADNCFNRRIRNIGTGKIAKEIGLSHCASPDNSLVHETANRAPCGLAA